MSEIMCSAVELWDASSLMLSDLNQSNLLSHPINSHVKLDSEFDQWA